ncbi:tetratricopeptide repeat protein [Methylomonas sp. AM2-LC]|uniref:tetratricopeptide repeat protein n=1 Tax=Methylomonas sp. AM2-LC TaxID=3153301 RepID=UPI0032638227
MSTSTFMPNPAESLFNEGNLLQEQRRFQEALDCYAKALTLQANFPEALWKRGNALLSLGQLTTAVDSYNQALLLRPAYAEALNNRGIALQNLGQLDQALLSFDAAIAINPDYANAYNNRGLVLKALGRIPEELACYTQAIRFKPDFAEAFNNQGLALYGLQQYSQAAESFSQALAIKPGYAKAHYNLGNVLTAQQLYAQAVTHYETAVSLQPQFVEAYMYCGLAYKNLQNFQAALLCFDQAIKLSPNYAEAHHNRGLALHCLHRYVEALDSYAHGYALKPEQDEAYFTNRGLSFLALGKHTEAIDCFERVLAINPQHVEACFNYANALNNLQRYREALPVYQRVIALQPELAFAYLQLGKVQHQLKYFFAALDSYRQTMKLVPEHAEAYFLCGNTLQQIHQYQGAADNYRLALVHQPDHVAAHFGLGLALHELKRYQEACVVYDQATALDPDYQFLAGARFSTKIQICDWRDYAQETAHLLSRIAEGEKTLSPFTLLAMTDNLAVQGKIAALWTGLNYPERFELPALAPYTNHTRIRVGFFSADFRNHPVAFLTAQMFELFDRSQFELLAFSFGPEAKDEMRVRLEAGFDQFHNINGKSDYEVALLARQLELDIAVDLSGLTGYCRTGIFSYRPAPTQVNYLGYAGSVPVTYMDYIIGDPVLIPAHCMHLYSEKVVHLPDSFMVTDSQRQIADKVFSRAEMGLPETGVVFCCFNNHFKITPYVFASWMRILQAVPGSVLWFSPNPEAETNLKQAAEQQGISGERLLFSQRLPSIAEHLARHQLADLFLDTLPYNAHATAMDALWAGLPVLTCAGESFASRVAASLLSALGLPELIVYTPQAYEEQAIELALQPEKLAKLKAKLAENRLNAALFDTERYTRNLEAAFIAMHKRNHAGLAPEHLRVM